MMMQWNKKDENHHHDDMVQANNDDEDNNNNNHISTKNIPNSDADRASLAEERNYPLLLHVPHYQEHHKNPSPVICIKRCHPTQSSPPPFETISTITIQQPITTNE